VNRIDLLHLIRAACDLLDVDEVVVLGSQAILATRLEDDLPAAATRSREADIAAPLDLDESLSHLLAGVLGEDSAFDRANGYFADGVSMTTAHLPGDWQQRAIRLESYSVLRRRAVTGLCPEAHDLCASKLLAFREKDREFAGALIEAGIVHAATLRDRLTTVPGIDPLALGRAVAWLDSLP